MSQICPLLLMIAPLAAVGFAFLINRTVTKENDRLILKVKNYEKLLVDIKDRSKEPWIKLLARKRFK